MRDGGAAIAGRCAGRRGSLLLGLLPVLLPTPAAAFGLPVFPVVQVFGRPLGILETLLVSIAIGSIVAATVASGLLTKLRRRLGDQARASAELRQLQQRIGVYEALLSGDDQRLLVFERDTATPVQFGRLPDRAGLVGDLSSTTALVAALQPESGKALAAAIKALRADGTPFQLAVRTQSAALLDVAGQPSGERLVFRIRELSGDRQAFAELKERAGFVVDELAARHALADALPIPMWRRSREGQLVWVNQSFAAMTGFDSPEAAVDAGGELLEARTRDAIRLAHREGRTFHDMASVTVAGERRRMEIFAVPVADGSVGAAIDVTAADAARDEVVQIRRRNARVLDELSAAVAGYDADLRLRFHNRAYRDLFGLSEAWLSTAPTANAVLDRARAEGRVPVEADYKDWRRRQLALLSRREAERDVWHLPDGRTLRVVVTPDLDGGVSTIFEDISRQRELEARLEGLSRLQGETLDHLAEGVAVFGSNGRLRLWNPAFARIWRLSPQALRGQLHIAEIAEACASLSADRGVWDAVRTVVTAYENRGAASGQIRRYDGSAIDVATMTLPEGMTMVTFIDVSDRARAAEALEERNAALLQADALKSQFLASINYQLRSPIQSILGFTELVESEVAGPLVPRQRDYLGHVATAANTLRRLIDDVLDFTSLSAGDGTAERQAIDPAVVLGLAVEAQEPTATARGVVVHVSVTPGLDPFSGDGFRVRQALENLLSNAIRHAHQRVRATVGRENGWTVFRITDDGPGIPPDLASDLFKPFSTAPTADGRASGIGLGLAIVRRIADLHGGTVVITPGEEGGAVAVLRFPPDAARA